jgi:hypothetical protein
MFAAPTAAAVAAPGVAAVSPMVAAVEVAAGLMVVVLED